MSPGYLRCSFLSCFLVLAALFLQSSSAVFAAQPQEEPPATALITRRAIAFNPVNGKIYAVDESRGAVSIIDTATNSTETVTVGAGPDALAVNAHTGTVYVVNSSAGTASVLDGKTDKVIATIPAGPHPYVLAVDDVTNKVYVTNTFSDQVAVIDGAANTVSMMKLGSADNVVVDPSTDRIVFLGYEVPDLKILNGTNGSTEKAHVGEHLWGLAINEATGTAYVTRTGNAEVVVLDKNLRNKTTIPVGSIPCAVAVDSKRNRVYVANYGDNSVTVIDGEKHSTLATVKVGLGPQAIAVDAKANLIYVANTHGNSVTVIDGDRYTPIETLPSGSNPFAIAVVPGSGRLYVANFGRPSVTAVDLPAAGKAAH